MSALAFNQMNIEEQIQHVQDLWDCIAARPDQIPVDPAQLDEVRRRRGLHLADPSRAITLDAARRRLRSTD